MSDNTERREDYKNLDEFKTTITKVHERQKHIIDGQNKMVDWCEKHSGEGDATTHGLVDKRLSSHSRKLNIITGIGALLTFIGLGSLATMLGIKSE